MRIVSLLPSSTEIVAALGKQGQLVGRSHECDYPQGVRELPVCTEPKFKLSGTGYQINHRIKTLLHEGLSVYRVDEEQLVALKPDIILTQDHCKVCAASFDEVKHTVKSKLGNQVKVISVSPSDLASVLASIRRIACAIDAKDAAADLINRMQLKMKKIQQKTVCLNHPNVLCIEWMNPLMSTGHWMPELVQLAGGHLLAATTGSQSTRMEWEELAFREAEIITIAPCGYAIHKTLDEISTLVNRDGWSRLRAVKNRQVFVLDGNQYFNRPGPRLVDSTQILGEVMHPSVFRKTPSHTGWVNLFEHQFHQTIGRNV